jgi:hypothetical protein
MLIEADEGRYRKCVENYRSYPGVQIFQGLVMYDDTSNDLESWLARGNMKPDFDVLSIDIDWLHKHIKEIDDYNYI